MTEENLKLGDVLTITEDAPKLPEAVAAPCDVTSPHTGEKCVLLQGHAGPHQTPDAHRCHAQNCKVPVKPGFLMCKPHWEMVFCMNLKSWISKALKESAP